MGSFLKFALSALAIFIFLSASAIEEPQRHFAPPLRNSRMIDGFFLLRDHNSFLSSVHGKKIKSKRKKNKRKPTRARHITTCDAY